MKKLSERTSAVKLLLVFISFVQVHWMPIVCAAGTAAAAAMFGDKGYVLQIGEDAEILITEKKPQEAIKMLESKIAEYSIWLDKNADGKMTEYYGFVKPELFYQLAVAKESAGYPKEDVVATYKEAIPSFHSIIIFSKLYSLMPEEEYKDLIFKIVKNLNNKHIYKFDLGYNDIQNWPAFRIFVDILLDNVDDPINHARDISDSLRNNQKWFDEFHEYCRSKPQLLEYILENEYGTAKKYIEKEDFLNAAITYEGIIKSCKPDMDTSEVQLKMYECYFNSGDYQGVIPKLDQFITSHRASHRKFVKEAILMKGKTHIQLGEIDKAADVFLTLTIEYPEAKNAPEANFFIGYCYMLQGKFDLAKEAMNLVISDYPSSNFAGKARLCIIRINSMTE